MGDLIARDYSEAFFNSLVRVTERLRRMRDHRYWFVARSS
jgi:hypothetical protein